MPIYRVQLYRFRNVTLDSVRGRRIILAPLLERGRQAARADQNGRDNGLLLTAGAEVGREAACAGL